MSIDLKQYNFNLNDKLIDILEQLLTVVEIKAKSDSKYKFKVTAYKKAIHTIKNYDKEIKSGSQAKTLDNIGKGISDKIDEFLKTGKISEIYELIDPNTLILNELQSVHGIGPAKASEFLKLNVTSVQDLKDKIDKKLIPQQINSISIGLKYFNDFKIKIPYEEIKHIYSNIKSSIETHYNKSLYKNLIINVCGSHRREKPMSGDIDILITHEDKSFKGELNNIVKILTQRGIITDHLTINGDTKFMGVCKIPEINIGRRIDIRYIDYESYYYAMLYFTGSVNLNKQMRYIAMTKNYTLNEYSMFDNFTKKKFIVNSEKEIFDILDCKYLQPYERDL